MTAIENTERVRRGEPFTVELPRGRSRGWWGMVLFLASEGATFAVLLGSYFYVRFRHGADWPPGGLSKPELSRAMIMTGMLVPSSLPLVWAERSIRRGNRGRMLSGVLASLLLGGTFLGLEWLELADQVSLYTITTNVFGSLFFAISGLDAIHVLVGVLFLLMLLVAAAAGRFGPSAYERIRLAALYWHFIAVVWIAILFTLYLSERI